MRDPFPTTAWTDLQHRTTDGDTAARRALAVLYEAYWGPLYAFLRRRGLAVEAAQDTLQSFYLFLFERRVVSRLDRSTSHLRSFLLTALKNYLNDQRDRESAQVRSPKLPMFSLDVLEEENRFLGRMEQDESPEDVFNSRWAQTLASRASADLAERERVAGNGEAFLLLEAHLFGGPEKVSYRDIAATLDISVPAVKVRVHRYRKRLGVLLRNEVRRTVGEAADADEELRFLVDCLRSSGGLSASA